MKKKVLITGASGFVGYHLIMEALAQGLEVHAAVRSTSKLDHLVGMDLRFVSLDFNNDDILKDQLAAGQYDFIIHSAGITKAKTAEQYFTVNAGYTKQLASAAMESGLPLEKFVFISSLAAIGPIAFDAADGITENTLQSPVTNYGKSKKLAEQYLNDIPELPLMVFRPTAVYGPREKDIFIMFKTLKNRFEPYIGTLPQRLSFIYVKDLAQIVVRGMLLPQKYNTYNVSDGNSYTRYELADATKLFLNIRTLKIHLPLPIVEIIVKGLERIYARRSDAPTLNYEKLKELKASNWECSIDLIQKELGFTPVYDLNKGIKETLAWYKANRWL